MGQNARGLLHTTNDYTILQCGSKTVYSYLIIDINNGKLFNTLGGDRQMVASRPGVDHEEWGGQRYSISYWSQSTSRREIRTSMW